MSAAHCFETAKLPDLTKVGIGVDGTVLEDISVERLIVHPKYIGVKGQPDTGIYLDMNFHDIATLIIDKEIPGMRPVGIASSSILSKGSEVLLAGYGYHSEEELSSNPSRKLSAVFTQVSHVNKDFKDIQLEANNNRGPCFGDSGGPLFIRDSSNKCLMVLGSVTGHSRGAVYTCDQGGGTITDVSAYQGWLKCTYEQEIPLLIYALTIVVKIVQIRILPK